jgi:hypothetical protein
MKWHDKKDRISPDMLIFIGINTDGLLFSQTIPVFK